MKKKLIKNFLKSTLGYRKTKYASSLYINDKPAAWRNDKKFKKMTVLMAQSSEEIDDLLHIVLLWIYQQVKEDLNSQNSQNQTNQKTLLLLR